MNLPAAATRRHTRRSRRPGRHCATLPARRPRCASKKLGLSAGRALQRGHCLDDAVLLQQSVRRVILRERIVGTQPLHAQAARRARDRAGPVRSAPRRGCAAHRRRRGPARAPPRRPARQGRVATERCSRVASMSSCCARASVRRLMIRSSGAVADASGVHGSTRRTPRPPVRWCGRCQPYYAPPTQTPRSYADGARYTPASSMRWKNR